MADAKELADRLGIGCDVAPIDPAHRALADGLARYSTASPGA